MVTNCLRSIIRTNDISNVEFIIVHNGDLNHDQIDFIDSQGGKLVHYTAPHFNVSEKLNLGVAHASGELLLLMNDDMEALSDGWITQLAKEFEKPWVGVVGAKLLFPDETIQHAGVILKRGRPDHVRKHYPREDIGYFGSTAASHNYVAVTGACMMVRADIYRLVGGYDEMLAVSYNDVDFCLKVRELDLTAVYVPSVEITHFESKSRDSKLIPAEEDYFQKKWTGVLGIDPFYNGELLSIDPPNFTFAVNSRKF